MWVSLAAKREEQMDGENGDDGKDELMMWIIRDNSDVVVSCGFRELCRIPCKVKGKDAIVLRMELRRGAHLRFPGR